MSVQLTSTIVLRSLAQGALRLEEVYQSLRENVFVATHEMQQQTIARSIQEMKQRNANTNRQLQALKQKVEHCSCSGRDVLALTLSFGMNPPVH